MSNSCRYCGVKIKDVTEHCPLCDGVLEHTEEGISTYPNVLAKNRRMNFLFRLFLFLSILVMGGCVSLNIMIRPEIWWSLIVIAALIYGLWLLYIITKDNAGYRMRILSGAAGGVIFIILTDWVLGFQGWSINYVLPAGIILVDLALLLLMLINRRNWQSYLILQIAMIVVGIIPLIFIQIHLVQHPLVSEIAFSTTVIMFLGTVILGGRTASNELKRRFHIR